MFWLAWYAVLFVSWWLFGFIDYNRFIFACLWFVLSVLLVCFIWLYIICLLGLKVLFASVYATLGVCWVWLICFVLGFGGWWFCWCWCLLLLVGLFGDLVALFVYLLLLVFMIVASLCYLCLLMGCVCWLCVLFDCEFCLFALLDNSVDCSSLCFSLV